MRRTVSRSLATTAVSLTLTMMLSTAPASAASFDDLDTDRDGLLSREEFGVGADATATYDRLDRDQDGLIATDEVNDLNPDWDYTGWDSNADNYLERQEFYDGYYGAYDANSDGVWVEDEWDNAADDGTFDW